jgi:hypothetical protein
VLGLIRDVRNCAESNATFFDRQSGSGPVAVMIQKRFSAACRRFGLNNSHVTLDTSQFTLPDLSGQLGLF